MKSKFHSIDSLFVLLLFALFVITALFITVSGAAAYRSASVQMEERFNKQTCISYITAKIRANNEADKITISDMEGISALCIHDNIDGLNYNTYIYQYEGMVCELFCSADISLPPSAGTPLTQAKSLSFERNGNLFEIKLTDNDDKITEFYVNVI